MKRYLALGGVVLALALGGWSLAWWLGRGEIERAVDESIARLQEQGWQVTIEQREITGFPFSYGVRLADVTISDPESGFALYLPSASTGVPDTRQMVFQLSDSFRADVPVPAPLRAAAPETGNVVSLDGEAEGMLLVLLPDQTARLIADHLTLRSERDAEGRRIVQSFAGVEVSSLLDSSGNHHHLHAREAMIEAELPMDGGAATAVAKLHDVTLKGASNLRSGEALAALLYTGLDTGTDRQAELTLDIGAAEIAITTEGASHGTLEWEARALDGGARLMSGRIELDFEARGNAWALTSPDPDFPLQGKISMELARASYAMPMAPSRQPAPMAFEVALDNGMAGEHIWDAIDPKGVLPRAPASLRMGLSGMARVTSRIDQLLPGAEPPFEFSVLDLDELAVHALGAKLQAAGEIEIIQPSGRPLGEIRVGMMGLSALVEALGEAELISEETLVTARAIMEVYLREASADDAWTAVIDFTSRGTEVNGLKVR